MSWTPEEACPHSVDVAAYLLGALEDPQPFEQHLRGCERCQAELEELQPAATGLATAVPRAEAPRAMRRRLLAAVEREAQTLRAAGPQADLPATRKRPRRRSAVAIAVALCVAAIAIAALTLGGPGTASHAFFARVAPEAKGAHATLKQFGSRAELAVTGMPQAPLGRVYQVWLKRRQQPPTATDALFSVTNRGNGSVNVPEPFTHVSEVMVTSEPVGGSAHPTTPPLLRFVLSATS